MSYSVENLEPKVVWKYFERIRQIPHGSRNEAALAAAIVRWAEEAGCAVQRDATGNVLVRVAASRGRENAPVAVLQGHIDMVCEKNSDKAFDFEKDPICLVRDGDWIRADGTTLGADNGIGVAIALSLMEDAKAQHGPLELLFTVDEETGLNGANGLEPGFVTGKLFVNLDSEEEGVFYVGCSGGRDTAIRLPIARAPLPAGQAAVRIDVKGLRGGHSGLDIVLNRGNAIRLAARVVSAAAGAMPVRLVAIEGGDKHNAIPREATATVAIPAASVAELEKICAAQLAGFRTEFAAAEPELALTALREGKAPSDAMDEASTLKVVALVLGLPHGVLAMSRDLPGLVETSSNMARVRTEAAALDILTSSRSSNGSALDGVIGQIAAVCRLAGASAAPNKGYPGWQPNMESRLLAVAKGVWIKEFGQEPKFTAIHAGLECGIIGEKYPGVDMISFGPTIRWPHSPAECVSIATVGRVAEFTKALLATLSEG
jgi:dipeptidase D